MDKAGPNIRVKGFKWKLAKRCTQNNQ
uniref:Uncharacterized protein n=1 Tax=Tetranychus urticae TaxID=32264 RepID=T1K1P6_TETUR